MGCGKEFCIVVKTLLGNATAHVNVNGELTESFKLSRSIKQGCPLAPLLYAIASDGLTWLVQDKMDQGKIKGIKIDENEQVYLELFASDTNALIANEEESIKEFWECLNIFCRASGSSINHWKTGIIYKDNAPPQWIDETGCRRYQEGEIFRLLGIPMGYKVSLQENMEMGNEQN